MSLTKTVPFVSEVKARPTEISAPNAEYNISSGYLRAFIAVVILAAASAQAQTPRKAQTPAASLPSDAEIHELLVDHVDLQHKSVGTVVGIISPEGKRIIYHGHLDQGDARVVDGDTVFEIGSITKLFTALLLSNMVQRAEVELNDPVAKYLPAGVTMPERNGRQITMVDLATHTSGLPFLPADFPGVGDPQHFSKYIGEISKYSDQQLYRFLSTYQLQIDPGTHWAYSNLGVGLLGEALALRAGMSYEDLVKTRITGPLGMTSTAITVSPSMKARLGVGHDAQLQVTPDWIMPVFAGAGSLRSSANDLLTFLAAFMNYTESPLSPAMAAMLETQRPGPTLTQALGWWIIPFGPGDDGVVFFGGETLGYASSIAYDPRTRVGVVVLSNGAPDDGGIGLHVLRPSFPVKTLAAAKALKGRQEIALDPKLLDTYLGKYQASVGGLLTIEKSGDGLLLRSASAPEGLRLHAQSERVFFLTEMDLTVTFQVDANARVTGLTIHFAGTDNPAPRIVLEPKKN
jgi:CubicO group peptidase (beta-lactamase class C family)